MLNNCCCCRGPRGPQGERGCTGPRGPQGEVGSQGPAGSCECQCSTRGELLINGGMEDFTGTVPDGWEINDPSLSQRVTDWPVNSGASSLMLRQGGVLCQTVPVDSGCICTLSFLAINGEYTVTLVYNTPDGQIQGLIINVRDTGNSQWGRFGGTSIAPQGATSATLCFNAITVQEFTRLDDVSLVCV